MQPTRSPDFTPSFAKACASCRARRENSRNVVRVELLSGRYETISVSPRIFPARCKSVGSTSGNSIIVPRIDTSDSSQARMLSPLPAPVPSRTRFQDPLPALPRVTEYWLQNQSIFETIHGTTEAPRPPRYILPVCPFER